MIELQRASAGSGKTYTLAKKYIWFLITIKPETEDARIRLRTESELADSARHILAMTFTNKATNEMQQRIVRRLFDLGHSPAVWKTDSEGRRVIKSPDYLNDFVCGLHGVEHISQVSNPDPTIARIAAVCRRALRLLLENYSDFKVSTIDSFFQQVLRTLAYETDNNDAYQVEIDSEFISQMAVDGTLEEIESTDDSDIPFWVQILMERFDKGLSMFTREMPEQSSIPNPYKDFVESVKKLQNEDYKQIRDEMERYFRPLSGMRPDLKTLYLDLYDKYENTVARATLKLKKLAGQAYDLLPDEILELSARAAAGQLVSYLRAFVVNKQASIPEDPMGKFMNISAPALRVRGKKLYDTINQHPGLADKLYPLLDECRSQIEDYTAYLESAPYRQWRLYAANLPYLALLETVTAKRREYLDENNAVELSETSSILNAIIDDSDTPFVYERMGTTLNHFLIDEFQDTSLLQWLNVRPLLTESLSHDHDNLIIGDAKQSIYRFRNADSSLITSGVQASFPRQQITTLGDNPGENTNYRSERRVVQFNNSFFRYAAERLDEAAPPYDDKLAKPGTYRRVPFKELYANVVQQPARTDERGFVEVTLLKNSRSVKNLIAVKAVERIVSLMERGYRQKDIAVLVNTNSDSDQIISAIMTHNAAQTDPAKQISYISEQSLKVASSVAVHIITGVLENMARGFRPELRTGEERLRRGVGNWHEIEASFKLFEIQNGGGSTPQRFEEFLKKGLDMSAVAEVMRSLQSLSIPALVEAVVARFVPEELRRRDAVFIAAFQDLVLEYCERHSTDVGSFLDWWSRRKRTASITSPDDVEAVRVMTIHKSKGLEFDCVIVPFVDWKMGDSNIKGNEWHWVVPDIITHPSIEMPPYMPVGTTPLMTGTTHEPILTDFRHQVKTDNLNKAYVAFTRAATELYVLAVSNEKAEPSDTMGNLLQNYFTGESDSDALTEPSLLRGSDMQLEFPAPDNPESATISMIARAGQPIDDVAELYEQRRLKAAKENDGNRRATPTGAPLDDYLCFIPSTDKLKTRLDTPLANAQDKEEDDGEDLDPRSEGNIKHAILERVRVATDLPGAVRHMVITGMLPAEMENVTKMQLAAALCHPSIEPWFNGKARVINERPILVAGEITRRPDRILVYPDGSAVVVDYKFGKFDKSGKYLRQIRRYVRLLAATHRFSAVSGYLWYVNQHIIQDADTGDTENLGHKADTDS